MEEQREYICVTCPVGCTIQAAMRDGELQQAQGQSCKRGITFVKEELTAPRRMLTTTVRVHGGALPVVPVRSTQPLPKALLLRVAAELRAVELEAPVCEHQVVLHNVAGTGVDMIASRDLPVSVSEAPQSATG